MGETIREGQRGQYYLRTFSQLSTDAMTGRLQASPPQPCCSLSYSELSLQQLNWLI